MHKRQEIKRKIENKQKSAWRDEDNMMSLIKKKKKKNCSADLCEDIFILHDQRVGVYMSGEEVQSVAFRASLGSALHILCLWREAKGKSIKSKLQPFTIKNDFVCIGDTTSWVMGSQL